MMITIRIPGEPVAQGRGRVAVIAGHARVYDPAKSRSWKGAAAVHMLEAMAGWPPLTGPVALGVQAVFSMPKSRWQRSRIRPAEWHCKRPDLDNVIKAVKDAAKGVLWLDDSQVVTISASKITGEQGQAPGLVITVTEAGEMAGQRAREGGSK